MSRFGRRQMLASMAGSVVWAARGGPVPAFARTAAKTPAARLLVRLDRPPQLETPAALLDDSFTANDNFFVRSHFDPPAPGLFSSRLVIHGDVATPLELTPQDLEKLDVVELPAVLQCSGNGRSLHAKRVPGIQWEKGAVGQAKWRGVRLAALLEKAGLGKDGAHLHLRGHDSSPHPNTPAFVRSFPIGRAMDPNTLVAFAMNGQPLPHLHGGPLRLVVPGWAGNHWHKWLCELTVSKEPAKGFFMDTGYQMPVKPGSDEYAPLGAMPVKSWITRPLDGAVLGKRAIEVRGHAFSGMGAVTRVEVSTDGGSTWAAAKVDALASHGAWQRWTFVWKPTVTGKYHIAARATDASGAVQPEISPANRSGYMWNGWDRVTCEVEA